MPYLSRVLVYFIESNRSSIVHVFPLFVLSNLCYRTNNIFVCKFVFVCYNTSVTDSDTDNRKEVFILEIVISFFLSITASIIAYYICKWLDAES